MGGVIPSTSDVWIIELGRDRGLGGSDGRMVVVWLEGGWMEERPWLEKEAVVEEAPCWRDEGGLMVERPWLEKEEVTCWREEGRGVEKATGAEWAAEDLSARL